MKIILVLCLFISACASTPDTINIPVPKERTVRIDERLLTECEQLTTLKDNPKPSDVLLQHGEDVRVYTACAMGKKKLIEEIRAAFPKD